MYPLNSFINTSAKITSFLHSFLLAQKKPEFGKALAKKIEQLWDINGKIRTQTEQANPIMQTRCPSERCTGTFQALVQIEYDF